QFVVRYLRRPQFVSLIIRAYYRCGPDLCNKATRIQLFDRVAVTARPLALSHALVTLVAILDVMTVPVVPLDHRQAVRPFVPIFDRVAI
ncbi:hypothetical protein, partial [Comamonas odontotermitis]|uniref:hypothetical protein n=1 Tax=Comamonas odontotermitis TaxID=379895 RepID=UPI001C86938E